jgi:type I restriction enzyme S subunit
MSWVQSQRKAIGGLIKKVALWNPVRDAPEEEFAYIDLSALDNATKTVTGIQTVQGRNAPSRARQLVKSGDILVSTVRPNLNGVARVPEGLDGATASTGFCVLRPEPSKLDESYLFHWVRSPEFIADMVRKSTGASYPAVSDKIIGQSEIPLPPLAEQKRIAAILDQADDLRRKRQRALDRLGQLGQAIFMEMFGDLTRNDKAWPTGGTLGDYAEIASGITKGRDPKGRSTRLVPYLAVVNVQDKRLQLDAPKEIEATEDEILRYRLQSGDLLLTEGGDPDKLGRGTLWNAELPECIHQNHVFRVRLSSKQYNPTFLNWLVGSAYGKQYFLRAAKQTTGIASINMSQLKAFPMLLPPLELQENFQRKLDQLRAATEVLVAGVRSSENLFQAVQHLAFNGELTASSLKETTI